MSAQDVISEFKELPPAERAQVAKFVMENDDSWIPVEFKKAMQDAEAGRLVEMEAALRETPPPRLPGVSDGGTRFVVSRIGR